ncbi:hypothetical protein KQH58_16095, partial [Mycetohabitans sp. B6]|nr:hypothetical protein [Mycetohabitans sp. B6]
MIGENFSPGDLVEFNAPSAADLSMTRTLKNALCLMDIKLLDHFIVTSDTILSLA